MTRTKLADLLKVKYPDYEWQNVYLLKGRFAQQRRLEKAVRLLFPVKYFFLVSLIVGFIFLFIFFFAARNYLGRRDNCKCKEGSRFDQPRDRRVFGIGYIYKIFEFGI